MKTVAIVGILSATLGVLAGSQIPRRVVSSPLSIITFKIKVPFDQWALGFDSKEAEQMHKANNISPLFRGVNVKNPSRVVVIHQSNPGSVKRFLEENKEIIESSGHVMSTTQISNWSFE